MFLVVYSGGWWHVRLNLNSTQKIKALADVRPIAIDDADSIIRTFHLSLGEPAEVEQPMREQEPESAGEQVTEESELKAEDAKVEAREVPEANKGPEDEGVYLSCEAADVLKNGVVEHAQPVTATGE